MNDVNTNTGIFLMMICYARHAKKVALWLRPGVIFVWFILEVYVIIKKH